MEIPPLKEYRMDHPRRGRAIIINNKLFKRLGERTGTDKDANSLEVQLSKLGFNVSRHDNLTAKKMVRVMEAAACEDHTDADCFAAAILSHGKEGVVFGAVGEVDIDADGEVVIDKLTALFEGPRCKSLVGKPKIFIIQACRGDKKDLGVDVVEADAVAVQAISPLRQRILVEADFLMCYSVSKDYVCWRYLARGSWFVQCLCSELEQFAGDKKMEFCRLLTRVNRKVSEHETNDCEKQVPCFTSMLTRDLYLSPRH